MDIKVIISTIALQIGFSLREIYDYFAGDLTTMFQGAGVDEQYHDIRRKLAEDRAVWLGLRIASEQKIDAKVEAVIADRHEGFDWDRWSKEGGDLGELKKAHFYHNEAMACLAQQGALPATLWPLLCFGYQQRGDSGYFAGLQHNPQWVIAPNTLVGWTDWPHYFACRNLYGVNKAREVLQQLIGYYGPGRVLALGVSGKNDIMPIPADLSVEGIDVFVEHEGISEDEVFTVTVGSPPATDTTHRAAIIGGYGEPYYPRVMGIRTQR